MNEQIAGIRALADFLEAHPEVVFTGQTFLSYTDRDGLVAAAKCGTWRKDYTSDNFFTLDKNFGGGVHLHVYTEREAVCRKVVTGTRIVDAEPAKPAVPAHEEPIEEWICDEALLETAGAK